MANKKNVFQTHVHVRNPETGDAAWFKPGDTAPEWTDGYVDPNHFEDHGLVDTSNPQAEPVNYEKMTKADLEALAADRGLDFEGNKADLVARLEASDAALQ